jgi:hypothetical protein
VFLVRFLKVRLRKRPGTKLEIEIIQALVVVAELRLFVAEVEQPFLRQSSSSESSVEIRSMGAMFPCFPFVLAGGAFPAWQSCRPAADDAGRD